MQQTALLANGHVGCHCNKDSFGKLAVQDEGVMELSVLLRVGM